MTTKSSASYGERAKNHPNALAKRLFEIAESKQTNITVSADLTTTKELLSIAEGRISPGQRLPEKSAH
jgi:orotidine-5'-phosphate decarboxylase